MRIHSILYYINRMKGSFKSTLLIIVCIILIYSIIYYNNSIEDFKSYRGSPIFKKGMSTQDKILSALLLFIFLYFLGTAVNYFWK
jgi:hypothetical protein